MLPATDTFGSYGRRRGLVGLAFSASRAFDRAVTWIIAIILALVCAIAGYAVWDAWHVLNGNDQFAKPVDAESFASLIAVNPDVCAWLTIDNTNIDYPVVQGGGNFEYLSRDAKGEYAASGSIFLDAACDRTFCGPYEVLMGHHMQYGKMFGDLDKFLDKEFFEGNQTGQLMLPDRTLELSVVAVMKADAYDHEIFGTPVSSDGMSGLVSHIAERALYQRAGALSATDHTIVLSTCASDGADSRTVVICKVVGERASGA